MEAWRETLSIRFAYGGTIFREEGKQGGGRRLLKRQGTGSVQRIARKVGQKKENRKGKILQKKPEISRGERKSPLQKMNTGGVDL